MGFRSAGCCTITVLDNEACLPRWLRDLQGQPTC